MFFGLIGPFRMTSRNFCFVYSYLPQYSESGILAALEWITPNICISATATNTVRG